MKKKLLGMLCALLTAFVLVACGSDELKERTFETEEMGVSISITFYYKGDKIVKQTTKNVIPYDSVGLESKEQAMELLDSESVKMQGIDGITDEIEYSDTEAIETLEVDYENLDYDKTKGMPGLMPEGDPDKGISMKETAKQILEDGFTEKK